jgi:ATP-dependent exoDNAse (exonuclease V) beta subunit
VLEGDRERYRSWQTARETARDAGARPSVAVETVTAWARRGGEDAGVTESSVSVIDAGSRIVRPSGSRFGTLVHAVLATVPLSADRDVLDQVVALQARILGAPADETTASADLVQAALTHPLIIRARKAWEAGRCRRETPITSLEPDGAIVEGVLDLAFEDDDGWTVVEFKTQAELAGSLGRYRRQVGKYAAVVARVTGRPVSAVLLRV